MTPGKMWQTDEESRDQLKTLSLNCLTESFSKGSPFQKQLPKVIFWFTLASLASCLNYYKAGVFSREPVITQSDTCLQTESGLQFKQCLCAKRHTFLQLVWFQEEYLSEISGTEWEMRGLRKGQWQAKEIQKKGKEWEITKAFPRPCSTSTVALVQRETKRSWSYTEGANVLSII